MSRRQQGPAASALGAVRDLAGTLIRMGGTRLRLAVVEIQEERSRVFSMVMTAFIALLLAAFGIGMLLMLVIVFFWDTYRVEAIAISAGVLLLGAIVLGLRARALARKPTLLRSTLQRLTEDTDAINAHMANQPIDKRMQKDGEA